MTSQISGCNTQVVDPIKEDRLLEEGLIIFESTGTSIHQSNNVNNYFLEFWNFY
jgi:hypothetical protein